MSFDCSCVPQTPNTMSWVYKNGWWPGVFVEIQNIAAWLCYYELLDFTNIVHCTVTCPGVLKYFHPMWVSSVGKLWRELWELQTSSVDLWDVGWDFNFSLCAVPLSGSCPKILEWGWWSIGDWSIGVKVGVVPRVELRGWVIEVRTYSIFELKYLLDKSEVFILIIGMNKR